MITKECGACSGMTLGDKGAICCRGMETLHINPMLVEGVDTTAAGYAFSGALAVALSEGNNLVDSLQFAAVAAFSVTKFGAQPTMAE